MPEAPLVSVITKKIQDRYLSKPALDRLRRALKKEHDRTRPQPRDLERFKREIDKLDRKINQGAERVLEAPTELVPTLHRKLEEYRQERTQLNAELESFSRRDSRSNNKEDEIDQAINALRNLGDALTKARPEDTRELLASIVTKLPRSSYSTITRTQRTAAKQVRSRTV